MVIDTSKLKISTKSCVSAILAASALLQVPEIGKFVLRVTARHHYLATVVGAITGIAMLLHEPAVQDALGIKRTIGYRSEVVDLKDAPKP